ncbi:MAG: phage tail sheath family protein, partial [Anaerolineales bacterium]|nr:phage tail sheath family protein [Anaerolineales bacterium]
MAVGYASPGVYVEEVDRGTKPIESAGTSIAAFIGITAEASRKSIDPNTGDRVPVESVLNKATLVTNWTQFGDIFGGFTDGAYLPEAVYGYFANGGGPCYVTSLLALNEQPAKPTAAKPAKEGEEAKAAPASESAAAALTANDYVGDTAARTGISGLEAIDEVNLVLCPDLMAGYDGSKKAKDMIKAVQTALITHCEKMRFRFALLDTPPGLNAQQAKEWREFLNFDTSHAALYYPWLEIANLGGAGTKLVPPSGHVVGIYGRSDSERGVHKVPANEVVRGAVGLEIQLSRGEQDVLNPIGINCIRAFPGRGIRVWGGRTLSSNGAWRYINVRRLFNMVGSSL